MCLGAEGPNVVLLSIDTLRSDRLGGYGSARPTSPALDSQARRGVVFSNVITESSWTLPSHMTIMTGLHPTTHGVTLPKHKLAPEVPTLAEILGAAGYRTYACTDGAFVGKEFGFDRGFETYDERRKQLRLTLHRAKKFISSVEEGRPYFAFLHTYAVHCPYDPREEYAKRLRRWSSSDSLETRGKCGNPDYNAMSLSEAQASFLLDQYDAGIREADDQLRTFFQFLEARDDFDRTLLVVLSDHGEEFLEHGQIGHERTLYLESLRVPLIFAGGGLAPGVFDDPVGLVDVMPTILELAGIEPPRSQGLSLVTRMNGDPIPLRAQYSELDRALRLRSILVEDRHLILDLDRGKASLFELRTDPYERHALGGGEGLTATLREHVERLARPGAVPTQELSDEKLEELRALGYVD